MRYFVFILIALFNISYSSDFYTCYSLFEKEKFLQAKKCFNQIKNKDFRPYINYFVSQINLIYGEKPIKPKKENTAVDNYLLLKLSGDNFYRKNYKRAKQYLNKINYIALDKEDLPFYFYLKANLYNDLQLKKKLATKYIYNRYYGYKTFLEIYKKLSKSEIFTAVKTLISHRMYIRALGIIPLLPKTDKTLYYSLYLNVKTGHFEEARNILNEINKNSKWYAVSVYILGYYAGNWEERKDYFYKLLQTKNQKYINKLALVLTKKAFHYKKYDLFLEFINYLPVGEEKVWYTFLYKYFQKNKENAYKYLLRKRNLIKNKNKLNYWLYLSSGDKKYLKKISNSHHIDFYYIIAKNKIQVNPRIIRKHERNLLIETLKKNGKLYRWAYREGVYLYKKYKKVDYLKSVIPEVVVRKLPRNERYIKPFGNLKPLIYAVMKQESYFYYKAVSFSNAVGLMQFVPKTAYWAARKRNDKDFDIVDMFNPYISIDYGDWYLHYLLKKFHGNIFYTVAAYNGGSANVIRTLKRFKPRNIAEFVEVHPFDETRNYVKKVYTNYIIYKQTANEE